MIRNPWLATLAAISVAGFLSAACEDEDGSESESEAEAEAESESRLSLGFLTQVGLTRPARANRSVCPISSVSGHAVNPESNYAMMREDFVLTRVTPKSCTGGSR